MSKMKKILLGVIATALVIGSIVLFLSQNNKSVVNVFNVSNISTPEDYSAQQFMIQGMVTTDQLQPVYVSSTQVVNEILVTEGQQVKKGDILLTYDSTLSDISILRKQLEVQKYQLELDRLQKELNTINSYRPGVPVYINNPSILNQLKVEEIVNEVVMGDVVVELLYVNVNTANLEQPSVKLFLVNPDGPESETPVDSTTEVTVNEETLTYTFKGLMLKDAEGLDVVYKPYLMSPEDTKLVQDSTFETVNKEIIKVSYDNYKITLTKEGDVVDPEPVDPVDPVDPKPVDPVVPNPDPVNPTPPGETTTLDRDKYPNYITGTGTKEDPLVFLYNDQLNVDTEFMNGLLENIQEINPVYVNINFHTKNDPKQDLLVTYKLKFDRAENSDSEAKFTMLGIEFPTVAPVPPEEPIEEPVEPPFIEPPYIPEPPSIVYTAAELAKMRAEKESEIRSADLSRKTSQMELSNLEIEKNNNVVLAQLDGVVSDLISVDEAKEQQKQLFQVSSSGGFVVNATISEHDLETYKVGDVFSVFSYESGEMLEGTLTSISKYPDSSQQFFHPAQATVSMYPVKLNVDKSANLKQGFWVEVRPLEQMDGEYVQKLYLMNAFIDTDSNGSFVLKDEGGKLVKQYIETGKVIMNQYTEILNNSLTMEANIAFPHAKEAVEGAPTREASMEDLYQMGG